MRFQKPYIGFQGRRQRKMSVGGGGQNKTIITRTYNPFWPIPKESERVGRCREKNFSMQDDWWGSGGSIASRRRQREEHPAFGDFYNFIMKITHF